MANQPVTQPPPGYIPTASLDPNQFSRIDQTRYIALLPGQVGKEILRQANQGKMTIGMPESWYALGHGDLDPRQVLNSDNSLDPVFYAQLVDWANSPQFAADKEGQAAIMHGMVMPTNSEGFVPVPLTPEQALAARKQDFTEAQALAKAAAQAVGGTVVKPPHVSGQATSQANLTQQLMATLRGTPVNTNVPVYNPEVALRAQLEQGKLNLDNLIFEADKAYKQASLAQNQQQFQSNLDYQKQRDAQQFGLDRATTISKFAANPEDAVAREYFLRAQGQQPTGTPVDIFTGQAGATPATQHDLAVAQAPLLAPYAQATGPTAPVVPALTPPAPPPGMAFGTKDGWTRAPKFIAGDPQVPGKVNPELIQLRVKDGEPQARVTPLNQMANSAPMYADGTAFDAPHSDSAYFNGTQWVEPAAPASISSPDVFTPTTYSAQQPSSVMGPSIVPSVPSAVSTPPAMPIISSQVPAYSKTDSISSILGNTGLIAPPSAPASPLPGTSLPAPVISPNDAYIAQKYGIDPLNASAMASARVQAAIDAVPLPQDTPAEAASKAERARIQASQPMLTPEALQAEANFNPSMVMQLSTAAGGVQMVDPTKAGYITNQQYYNPTLPVGLRTTPTGAPATYTGPMASGVGTNEYQAGLRGSLTTPEPPAPSTNPLVRTDYEPGMGPAVTPATQGSPTVMGGIAVSAPQAGGYRIVGQNGTYTTPDGGGTATVQVGDRIGPDGIPYRFNTLTNTWSIAPVRATVINSLQDFYNKPASVRNKILSGQPTNYVLADTAKNDWVASLLNPRQMTFPGTPDATGIYPAGTLPPGVAPVQLNPVNEPAQPAARGVNGIYGNISVAPGVSGIPGSAGWRLQPNPTMNLHGPNYDGILLPAPGAGDQAYVNYVGQQGNVWRAEDTRAAQEAKTQSEIVQNQYRQTLGLPPIPGTAYQPLPSGTPGLPPGQGGVAPGQGGAVPGQGYVIAPPVPIVTPPVQVVTPPGQGGTSPGRINAGLPPGQGGISTLSYGPGAYYNLPLMRYLRGEITPGEFNTIASQPIEVPALGLTGKQALPAISALNYGKLLNLKQTDPEGYALLDSMYKAANVGSLDSILAYHRSIAPLGTAYESSLVET